MVSILLVKTSSLGDVVHNLPVVHDILQHVPNAQIDWLVEADFADIPRMHPGVSQVIPVQLRHWRKHWMQRATREAFLNFRAVLRAKPYDYVIDTQGLLKSAWLTRLAVGKSYGFNWRSIREKPASLFYRHTFSVKRSQHAIERNRQLVAAALCYILPPDLHYNITPPLLDVPQKPGVPYVVMLHATSRKAKRWLDADWIALGQFFVAQGLRVVLPWGNALEFKQSQQLAQHIPQAVVPEALNIKQCATLLGDARLVVGVDTGLTHLAAALGKPLIAIYAASDPWLTGAMGENITINIGAHDSMPPLDGVIRESERLLHEIQF